MLNEITLGKKRRTLIRAARERALITLTAEMAELALCPLSATNNEMLGLLASQVLHVAGKPVGGLV
ncbi:hypothetical protein PVW53_14045 [Seohaeicola sp. SP36]|uniref:hypothetical protein n=1 Tax=unclassified Seohaeicola TaxID=2641111 RepID=UPI00237B2CDB|nr:MULTISPECIES: hypothetical protein [unclassified Seohaeicola]MDD9708626.1 hypothetical protein [Seohaeicola sp. 4SK31]MDD9736652.1 hypothetical protein [Seohaeicola sp. SP36]